MSEQDIRELKECLNGNRPGELWEHPLLLIAIRRAGYELRNIIPTHHSIIRDLCERSVAQYSR